MMMEEVKKKYFLRTLGYDQFQVFTSEVVSYFLQAYL